MAESITITDNRTGESLEIPIVNGGVSATEWSKLLPGIWFYDPGFMSTAACESADHLSRRRRRRSCATGATRSSSWPSTRPTSRSPTCCCTASCPTEDQFDDVEARDHVPHLHPRERAQAVPRGLPLRRPPHGHAGLGGGRAVDLLPRRQGDLRPGVPLQADHPAHRQDADPGRRRPPLQRRHAVRLPGQLARLRLQLPLDDVEGGRAPLRGRSGARPGPRRALHPPRRPRAELLDHGHAGGRARPTPIPTRPPRPPPPPSTAPATAGPTRRSSGC